MSKKIVLEAKNIGKWFASPESIVLFKEVNLRLHQGESVAIIGPSGVGKSTLLNIFGTLESASEGELWIANAPAYSSDIHTVRNKHIGFIFQSYNLLENYSVLDNILMPARIARKPVGLNSESHQHAMYLLEQIGLLPRKDFLAKYLSGGEKQRVALARALINNPSFLLADEPTGNLDQKNAQLVHELLVSCAKQFNTGFIVVTHNQELAEACDRKFILKNCVLECIE